ncbi:MAG TPA: hypothetical protein V6D22_17120 [Candidatus Obscuribacterales bacterium]
MPTKKFYYTAKVALRSDKQLRLHIPESVVRALAWENVEEVEFSQDGRFLRVLPCPPGTKQKSMVPNRILRKLEKGPFTFKHLRVLCHPVPPEEVREILGEMVLAGLIQTRRVLRRGHPATVYEITPKEKNLSHTFITVEL